MENEDVENSINCIKEFIQTFSFAKNVELILDDSKIRDIHEKCNENNSKVINLYSSYCIWLCMNEIYPAWFDISIHPAQFDTDMEAYECLLKYIDEYHENKYKRLSQHLIDNLKCITVANFVDIYSLIILAALVSDDKQTHINNILSVSHKTQECIHKIVEYLDKEEEYSMEKDTLKFRSTKSLSHNLEDEEKEKDTLKHEIRNMKEKIRTIEIENEKLQNLIAEKDKIISDSKTEICALQKQINVNNEKSKSSYISQIEELEKKVSELQTTSESLKKEKSSLEYNLNNKIKELEDEVNILKQENLAIDNLQNKINKYKEKLNIMGTVQNRNKELEEKLQQNTQKMIDMEIEMEKIKKEAGNIEKYKDRCADLDVTLVNLRKENEKLKQDLTEKNNNLEKMKKDLDAKKISNEMLKKEKQVDHFQTGLSGLDQTEELIRAKKEIENLKKQLGLDTNEKFKKLSDLENEIDDLKRINQKLEKKITELLEQGDVENALTLKEKYETVLKESEDKQKKIDELVEANQKIMLQIANFKGSDDISIKEKMIKLEAELMIEKKNCSQIEETTKHKLSKEFNAVLQILKEQLQIREKENEHYKAALKAQIDVSNEEQKLLSGIVHNLGLKYKQLQTYNLSLRNELVGIKMRKENYTEESK